MVLGAVAATCLAACDDDNSGDSSQSEIVSSIKIVADSITTKYIKGATPNYDNLSIDLFNESNDKIKTLKWIDNKDSISHTEIDTSELATGKVFTVTYKDSSNASFTDSIVYNVVNKEYSLSSWEANNNYVYTTSYKANPNISSSEDKLETGFMKSANFYVGNMNEVNLLPVMNGYDKTTMEVVTLSEIPAGASLKLSKDGTDLSVDDYIENSATFIKDGKLKFKGGVTGSYKVTLSYKGQTDIVYDIEVVSGYNVTKATDLFAFYTNSNAYWPYMDANSNMNAEALKFKTDLNLPDADNLVIQNDITIGKNDLPSSYFWSGDGVDKTVVGSLKDWLRIYNHEFKNKGDTATIYGNMHRMSLNNDESDENFLPYIKTDSASGVAQETNKAISSHASLFYAAYGSNQDPFECKINFKDLQAVGNHGVTEDTEMHATGPMFFKSEIDASFSNDLISRFYMSAMSDGTGGILGSGSSNIKEINGHYIAPQFDIESSRFSDSANAALYFYGAAKANITNTEIVKAGGPLIFTNPLTEKLPDDITKVQSFVPTTSIDIAFDDNSFVSNYTVGKGGWFEAYEGASALAGNLKSMNALFTPYNMSFLKTFDETEKFNLILVNLPLAYEEGLALPSLANGGVNVNVTKGAKVIYSTLDGYAQVMTSYAAVCASQTSEAYNAYAESLSGTFFGNNLAYSTIQNEMVFAATDVNGKHEFGIVNQNPSDGSYFLCSSDYAIKSTFASQSIPVTVPASPYPGETMRSAGYLAATINGTEVYSQSPALNPTSYAGVVNYGVILGDYHAI